MAGTQEKMLKMVDVDVVNCKDQCFLEDRFTNMGRLFGRCLEDGENGTVIYLFNMCFFEICDPLPQASNWDAMSQLLRCGGINDTDAFGVGPYFNGYGVLPNPDSDLELLLTSYDTEVNTSIQRVKDHKAALQGWDWLGCEQ